MIYLKNDLTYYLKYNNKHVIKSLESRSYFSVFNQNWMRQTCVDRLKVKDKILLIMRQLFTTIFYWVQVSIKFYLNCALDN